MPYAFFDRVENKFLNVLQRAKWVAKPLWMKYFVRHRNYGHFLVNHTWAVRTYRNPTLKKGDVLTVPLTHVWIGGLSKLEVHNLVK